jgi:tetratricopeptide (TPR) repeat protein
VTSSYLKAMQLSKQLEEKAKEEKKNRQLAEDELQRVEEAIKSAEASDIETANANKFFTKAHTAFEEKNYRDALSLVTQANEQIKKDFKEGVQSILNSAKELMEMSKDMESDTSGGLAMMEEAKNSLNDNDFEKAITFAKQSWEIFEKIAQEHLSESFSNAQSMIVLARNSGEDVTNSEALLEDARKAIEAQEYSVAFSRLKECLESVGTGLSSQIDELLDEAKSYQITARELGADVARIEELIQRTDEEMEKDNMEAALSSARLSKSEAEKTLNRGIVDFIELQKTALLDAEQLDANLDKASDLLERANATLKGGNYTEAIGSATEAEAEIQNAQFQKVLESISQSRSKFVAANKVGADLSEAMEYLNNARESLKEGKYLEALELAVKGDTVVDEIVQEFESIENTIAELEEQLQVGKERGIDLSSAENSLGLAKEALEVRDFESVTSYIKKVRGDINNASHSFATDYIETAELVISAGDRLGANLSEPEELLKHAITVTKEGDYQEAIKLAEESTTRAEAIIKIHVSNTIASAELAIYDAENVDVDTVQELIDSAKQEFEAFAFDKAFEYADKALNMLETAQSAKARDMVKNMDVAIHAARKMDCDVKPLEDVSKKCEDYLNSRDFASALDEAEKAYKDALNLQYVAAERMFGEGKLAAIEAKKLGIDISDMREALKRAKLAFSEEKFEKTFKESESAKVAAERQIKLHKEAYDTITQAAAMVAEAKKNKAEVRQVMAILTSAKSMFEHFDYENAKTEAEKAIEETRKVVMLYTSADKLATVKTHITLLESLGGVELEELKGRVQEAKDSLKRKDYEKALSLSEDAEEKASNLLESGVANLVSSAESAIMDATDVGIDVTSQSKELEQARKDMKEKRFEAAIQLSRKSMKEVERIKELSQRAAVEIKLAQGALNEGETLHADMSRAKDLLNGALSELKSSKYEKAIELASESTGEARRSVETFVSETIKSVQVAIEKAKMDGTTIDTAQKLMKQAQEAFEKKDFKTALGLSMKGEGELEKVGLQQEMAEKAITTAETKLREAKDIGMHSSKAVSLLNEAKNEVKEGQYVKALEHAIQSGDEIHAIGEEFREAVDTLGLLETQIEVATRIKAEISIAKKMLADAEGAKADHDYRTATEIAKEGIIEARRLSHSCLSTKLTEAYKLTDLAAKYNIDVSGAGPVLAEAKTFMGSGKFEVSNQKIDYCLEEVEGKLNMYIMDVVDQSERAMEHAKEVGADIEESGKLLASAKEALGEHKYRDALNLAEKSKSAIDLEKGFEREFIELTYEAEKIISNSKKFGINMKESETLFKTAREQKEKDYQTALVTLRKTINTAHAAVKEFRPKLTAELPIEKIEVGVLTEVEIIVTNDGKALAKDVEVSLIGDVTTEGLTEVENIRGGGGEVTLPVKLRFESEGEMPLILKLRSTRIMDGKTFEDESVTNVFVTPAATTAAPKAEAFQRLKAETETKCNICMGTVKPDLDIIRCNCGREYHAMCGERFGECPGCGTSFTEGEVKSDIEDLEVAKKPMEKPGPAEPAKPAQDGTDVEDEDDDDESEEIAFEKVATEQLPPEAAPEPQAEPEKKKKKFFGRK